MAMLMTIGCGDEGGHQRTEQEVLTPLRRTGNSCVEIVVVPVMLVPAAARRTLVSRVLTRANGGVLWPNVNREHRRTGHVPFGRRPVRPAR